ncbi:MAG: hypothetical protein WCY41_02160 [Candidatus Micrarchaeia archaeon]
MGHAFADRHIDEPVALVPLILPPHIEDAGAKLKERARRILNNPDVMSACVGSGVSLNNFDFLRLLDFRRKTPDTRVAIDSLVFQLSLSGAKPGDMKEMLFEKMSGAGLAVWGALKANISIFLDSGGERLEFCLTPAAGSAPMKYALKKSGGALELCRVKDRTLYGVLSSAISLCKIKDMVETESIAAAQDYLGKREAKSRVGEQTAQFAATVLETAAECGENPKMDKLYWELSPAKETRTLVFCQSEEQEKLLNEQFGEWFPSMVACHKLSDMPAAKAARFDSIIIYSRPGKAKAFEKYLSSLPKGMEIIEYVARKSMDAPRAYPGYNARKGGAQLALKF